MKKYVVIIDLHCDPTIPSGAGDIGGGNTYSRSLLQELQKNKVYHIYITRKKYPHLEEYICMTPFSKFYRIDLGNWGPTDKDVLQNYHLQSKKLINAILSKYKGCSFIFHSSYWQSGMLAYELAKEHNTFYVHTILSNAKKKELIGAVEDIAEQRIQEEEKIFAHAKYLICSSLSEINEMQELYSIPLEHLILAGLKVDNHYLFPAYNARGEIRINTLENTIIEQQYLSYFTNINSNDDYLWWNRKNFIYFGRIHKNKGIKEIITAWVQAYNIAGEQMPNLWIVGGAPSQIERFRNDIKEDIPQLENFERQHRIIWWGTLPPEGISTLLLKSSVLVTHSKYEAGGLVLLEALNQGIPVIATPNGYGKDYLEDWYNGFIVPYNDIPALRKKLLFFCNQPFLTDYMGKNARESAKKIEQTFDFFHSHMYAYGLETELRSKLFSKRNIDWYQAIKLHSMDIYPYLTELPSQLGITQIIQSRINCTVLNIQEIGKNTLDYKLWEITTNDGIYLFAFYYDIINTTNIWNPCSTEEYVLTKAERIHTLTELFDESKALPIIYKNTACGYVIYKGNTYEVFSEEIHLKDIISASYNDEASILKLKLTELLDLLNTSLIHEYEVLPLINFLQNVKQAFKTNRSNVINIPFASIYSLNHYSKENVKMLSFDKAGLRFKHLRNAPQNAACISEIFNFSYLTLEQLWSIYFELYTYIEQLCIYSKDSKTDFINTIYQKYS